MEQPPLDHHYVVMHLGGAKHVTRRRDGPVVSKVVENGSLTLVPAGTAYAWRTEGPIAFAHLYVPPGYLEEVVARELGKDGRGASLIERVGCRDRLLESLFARMIEEVGSGATSTMLLDSLHESFAIRLARSHTDTAPAAHLHAVALAPHRLRRVTEFIDAHLGCDLSLADLACAAGTSQYHFSRAFHEATGYSPYRFLLRRRMELARVLLLTSAQSLEEISTACGFNSRAQFALMFKRQTGVGPKRYRLAHAPRRGDGSRLRS